MLPQTQHANPSQTGMTSPCGHPHTAFNHEGGVVATYGALIPGWDEVASILRCCCSEIWKGKNVVAVCNVCNHNILAGAQHSKHSGYQLAAATAAAITALHATAATATV